MRPARRAQDCPLSLARISVRGRGSGCSVLSLWHPAMFPGAGLGFLHPHPSSLLLPRPCHWPVIPRPLGMLDLFFYSPWAVAGARLSRALGGRGPGGNECAGLLVPPSWSDPACSPEATKAPPSWGSLRTCNEAPGRSHSAARGPGSSRWPLWAPPYPLPCSHG